MAMTGKIADIGLNSVTSEESWPLRTGLRRRLLSGLSAVAFLGAVSLPVTIDLGSLSPELATAQAVGNGQGGGNGDGQGRGKGNGKGRGDENGGRKKPGDWGDDDQGEDDQGEDDHGDDDDGHDDDDDDEPGRPNNDRSDDRGDNGDMGEDDEAMATGAVAEVDQSPEDAVAGTPTATLPTVRQIFSLGEEAVLSAEQELLAIENGWNAQN